MNRFLAIAAIFTAMLLPTVSSAAIAMRAGFNSTILARNDDGFTGLVPIGFTVNFFGNSHSSAFVNNNGNITFDAPLSTFTPFNLTTTDREIIAPFFADVDTRNLGSDVTRYGAGTVDGRAAWGVTWDGVGYYNTAADKLNRFQVILIDRSDIGPGDFDIEFNYNQIQWETGSASGGSGGLGGSSARAGFSNGSGDPGTSFELVGSAINGAFLDSNLLTGLIHNSLNSSVDGRYIFTARNGIVSPSPTTVPEVASLTSWGLCSVFGLLIAYRRKFRARRS
jgi:hypothetical protein